MAKDPYQVLGVPKTASDDEIRKAYRKLAKKLHPDVHPGDKGAEDRFKEVSSAFAVIGDPETRARYDRGEIDAAGQEKPQPRYYRNYAEADGGDRYHSSAGYEDFADMSDLFSDLFGRRAGAGAGGGGRTMRMRGADRRYHLELDFLDAVYGAKRRVTMPDGATLDVTIPAGVRDGGTLRLKGKGSPGLGGGPAGDALVEIAVRPHPVFRREGDDIVMDLPITVDEALLGAKVEVPTITGPVNMTIPAGVQNGAALRLKGKGVKAPDRPAGDQRVTLRVTMPPKVDAELKAFMEEWRKTHRYDPREKLRRAM